MGPSPTSCGSVGTGAGQFRLPSALKVITGYAVGTADGYGPVTQGYLGEMGRVLRAGEVTGTVERGMATWNGRLCLSGCGPTCMIFC